ncbi:MAG: hypothetical protein QOE78_3333, partial [Alphaproteobacteria bacterium]|nr:hypothetical protein [Alphaproteobacteria bacterium]
MPRSSLRLLTAGLSAAMLFVACPTFAQSTDQKPAEKPPASDAKDTQKKIDEDLAQLKHITNCVRTYSIDHGLDQIP